MSEKYEVKPYSRGELGEWVLGELDVLQFFQLTTSKELCNEYYFRR